MIRLRSPGRICLFGEHQDYLMYPVIAMAISKYIYLKAERISKTTFLIELPDINDNIEIELNNKELQYASKRDYIRSGYNQFLRKGIRFDKGYKIKITGDIPLNAGVGSSSALVIAWLSFLNLISNNYFDKYNLALEGYSTEVKEFDEAGGMMDHFTSVYGNLLYLDPNFPKPKVINEKTKLEGFVLGNSLEKKETVEDLLRVKTIAVKAFEKLKELMRNFNQYKTSLDDVKKFLPNLKEKYQKKIIGNIINRDITIRAKNLIFNRYTPQYNKNYKVMKVFNQQLGNLLNKHHEQLGENIGISTKKIEKMISACLENGTLGAKINGSGFGGTMFALFPGSEKVIKNSIEKVGGEAFVIKTSNGVETY